jgi:hypothetical protein
MSQEHEKNTSDTQVTHSIHPEAAPFEPGYQPETLPHISVPDLAEDAQGLTAEALANVPTLTDLVEPEHAPAEVLNDETDLVVETSEPNAESATMDAAQASIPVELDAPTQAEAAQADTWGEQLQVRMGKLTDDIHTLNVRLDRLEERNKKKV